MKSKTEKCLGIGWELSLMQVYGKAALIYKKPTRYHFYKQLPRKYGVVAADKK